ncbi:MAG: ATP-dependent RNA helicase [Spirochaetales bacterium]|nr:ATP-dependent RNA helicase [Spirochaetales bacterium]
MNTQREKINPESLPVYRERKRILDALESNQVIVVESPTGSGKTTQLPLILNEAGYSASGIIGVTQPRRIATLSVCDYISEQLNVNVGDFVGYKMRFEDKTKPETRVKVMTDGILLQEIKADPYLGRYSVLMIDEAHERSLNIDFILGLLKNLLKIRKDLRVIISSATINAGVFSEYFNKCPVIHIDTETFPVEIHYAPPRVSGNPDSILERILEIVKKHIQSSKGDILIFLPGERLIKDCVTQLYSSEIRQKLFILPLYGRLSREEQERVFIKTPENKIKVVVATNIAETSVTIDGITTVIDPGLAKINFYNPRTYTSSLVEQSISKASSNQRKGRAGRTQAGDCYRLYSEDEFSFRELYTLEEIYRTDLSEVVLRMAELGITDFSSFDFISSPGKDGLVAAVETLRMFGAIDDENTLTSTGQMMVAFPMLPRHSRMIVEAINRYPDVIEETITAASFLTSHSPYILPQGEELAARNAHHSFRDVDGDFVSYLKIYESYMDADVKEVFCKNFYLDERIMSEIANIKTQIEDIVRELGVPISGGGKTSDYLCAVSAGLMQFVCCRSGRGVYRSLTAGQISIHPGSVMFRENPRYIVAGEVVRTSRMFARSVSPLKREWLKGISEDLYYELTETISGSGARQKSLKQVPDNTVRIGGKSFKTRNGKGGRKIVVLPWPDLRTILKTISSEDLKGFKKLRGTVLLGDCEFLSGEKLNRIVKICKLINPEHNQTSKIPQPFYINEDLNETEIFDDINLVMKLYRKDKKRKKFGFVTLHTDGNGTYWFSSGKSFFTSLEESLSSLEEIADELKSKSAQKQVGRVYRRLTEMLEAE